MQENPLSLFQNLIKVPFNLMQIALALNYLFTAQSAAGGEAKIQHMLKLGISEWQAAFLPGCVGHASDWWIEIRRKLLEAESLRAFSVEDLKCHLGFILFMLQGISLEEIPSVFIPWIQGKSCTRPFGGRASLALFCSSFSITTVPNNQSADIWMFHRGFVIEMHRDLGKSPLFDTGIRIEHLDILLRNVEAVLDLENERSAAIQPYSLNLRNLVELEAYYVAAFRAIEPGVLLNIREKWKTVWNQYQWDRNKSLRILGPVNYDTMIQQLVQILWNTQLTDTLRAMTKHIKGLRNSRPDRMIMGEILYVRRFQERWKSDQSEGSFSVQVSQISPSV